MIGKLSGIAEVLDPSTIIIDVNGVGFLVTVPIGTTVATDGPTVLYIYTAVREDAIELFGFSSILQKTVFDRIVRVSGIGPKLGLAILGRFTVIELISAIETENYALLTTISGVGKKTAQRLILELRSKFNDLHYAEESPSSGHTAPLLEDLRSALLNLGYTEREITNTLQSLKTDESSNLDSLLRSALRILRTN